MALITIERPNATYHINDNKVSVAYNYANNCWQVALASGVVLDITEQEYQQFVTENNDETILE